MRARIEYHFRVGLKIKEIREKRAMSSLELAQSTKLSHKVIKNIEEGKRDIKISELFRISKALGIRIGGFLNSCDLQQYERKKEELIDSYIPLNVLSTVLDLSVDHIKVLCTNKEIPFYKINNKYFFRASQINTWLHCHCSSKKKINESQFPCVKIFGIEPLISTGEAAKFLGCSKAEIYSLRAYIPRYYIRKRIKFRISDIENALKNRRVDAWEITSQISRWRSPFVKAYPTREQMLVQEASREKKYNERARPGYIVRTESFESHDIEDLKQEVQAFLDKEVNKYNALGCLYSYDEYSKYYRCEAKWWGLPEGRENFRVHSTGLSSDTPNHLHEKVMKLRDTKIPPGDFIGIDYFTWGASFIENCHCARVTYYMPRKTNETGEEKNEKI